MANPFDLLVSYWGDPLKDKSAAEIAGFYRRLAGYIEGIVGKGKSNASKFLLWWLDGKGKPLLVPASAVNSLPQVKRYLETEVRTVFLSERKVAHTGKRGGIVPRLKKTPPYHPFVQKDSMGNFLMTYEGPPVTTISKGEFASILNKYRKTKAITGPERRSLDIFTSFHKFGIESKVAVSTKQTIGQKYKVSFEKWTCTVFDSYDWNYHLGFPVPNPDHGSKDAGAIAPTEEIVVVRHKHAKKVTAEGLAHDFKVKTAPWRPTEKSISGPAIVDLSRFRP